MSEFFNGGKNVYGITKSRRHYNDLLKYSKSNSLLFLADIIENDKFIYEIKGENGERHWFLNFLIGNKENGDSLVYKGRSYDLAKDVIREAEPKLTVFTGNDLVLNCAMHDGYGNGEKNGLPPDVKKILKNYANDEEIHLEYNNDDYEKRIEMKVLQQSGNPKLCFMIPKDKKIEDIFGHALERGDNTLKVTMDGSKKYARLFDSFYYNHLFPNFKIAIDSNMIYSIEDTEGDAEFGPMKGISDVVFAIVDSGKTHKDAGLKIFDEIGPTYLVAAKCYKKE